MPTIHPLAHPCELAKAQIIFALLLDLCFWTSQDIELTWQTDGSNFSIGQRLPFVLCLPLYHLFYSIILTFTVFLRLAKFWILSWISMLAFRFQFFHYVSNFGNVIHLFYSPSAQLGKMWRSKTWERTVASVAEHKPSSYRDSSTHLRGDHHIEGLHRKTCATPIFPFSSVFSLPILSTNIFLSKRSFKCRF